MASLVKFECFTRDLASGLHDLRDSGDTLKIYLTNSQPSASEDEDVGDLPTEITAENGYASGGIELTISELSSVSGVARCIIADELLTASEGSIGPFRYAVLYNDTASDILIGYYDYGSSLTLQNGESLNFDFHDTNGFMSFT